MRVLVITSTNARARNLLQAFSIERHAAKNTSVFVRSVDSPLDLRKLIGIQFDVAFVDPDARFAPQAYEAVWALVSVKCAEAVLRLTDMELKAKEQK